jgi:hypothetical protein
MPVEASGGVVRSPLDLELVSLGGRALACTVQKPSFESLHRFTECIQSEWWIRLAGQDEACCVECWTTEGAGFLGAVTVFCRSEKKE